MSEMRGYKNLRKTSAFCPFMNGITLVSITEYQCVLLVLHDVVLVCAFDRCGKNQVNKSAQSSAQYYAAVGDVADDGCLR